MDGEIKIWSLKDRVELYNLSNKSNSIQKIYWKKIKNKDSKIKNYILSTDDTYLFLWNISEKQMFQKYEVTEVNDIAFFDGNEKFVTVSASGEIFIWDIKNDKELFRLNIGRAIMKVEINELEKKLILGEHNGQIQFLKIENLFE
jgi:WD40 repeat protein